MLRTITVVLTLAALSTAPHSGLTQEPASEPTTPVVLAHEAKVLLPTRVFHPPEFDPKREQTLIMGFHGYGASARGFSRTARALAERGFLVALPESAYPVLANGELGFQWFPSMEDDPNGERVAQLLFLDHAPSMLADLETRYSIGRVYALGFSEGAVAALGTALLNHENFDGSIQLGLPLFSEDWVPERTVAEGKGLRLLFLHGEKDERAPLSISKGALSFFREAGYGATLHVFDGGHTVPQDQLQVVADWIQAVGPHRGAS